jgi:anti-sigma regulatory factor (Ser/Thr protein kinase)
VNYVVGLGKRPAVIVHSALAYGDTNQYIEATAPFVQGGLACGDPVLVVTTSENASALERALGAPGESVTFARADGWYASQARALTRYLRFWEEHQSRGARGLRMVVEPMASSVPDEELDRVLALENELNHVLDGLPFSMLCSYDVRRPGFIRDAIEATHPHVCLGATIARSTRYVEPALAARRRLAAALPIPTDAAYARSFNEHSLHDARTFVRMTGHALGLPEERTVDLIFAAGEAIANAVEHGGGNGIVRLWRDSREIVCEVVSAQGTVADPMRGYLLPSSSGERGRGIWIMRQLCDWVELRSEQEGTIARLHMRITA